MRLFTKGLVVVLAVAFTATMAYSQRKTRTLNSGGILAGFTTQPVWTENGIKSLPVAQGILDFNIRIETDNMLDSWGFRLGPIKEFDMVGYDIDVDLGTGAYLGFYYRHEFGIHWGIRPQLGLSIDVQAFFPDGETVMSYSFQPETGLLFVASDRFCVNRPAGSPIFALNYGRGGRTRLFGKGLHTIHTASFTWYFGRFKVEDNGGTTRRTGRYKGPRWKTY